MFIRSFFFYIMFDSASRNFLSGPAVSAASAAPAASAAKEVPWIKLNFAASKVVKIYIQIMASPFMLLLIE